jgi:DNA-binding PadR family transcriptional regulator
VDGRGRKAYRLTELGQAILEAEYQRLQGLVHVARLRFQD